MRRRTDERNTGLCVTQARDEFADLVSGKLAAFAGLGALGDFDFQLFGVNQVLGGYAEASGGDLLDLVVEQRDNAVFVAVRDDRRRIFATLAGVGARAKLVHGHGDGLVCLGTERAERHGAGDEALYQRSIGGSTSVEFELGAGGLDLQQIAQYGRLAFVCRARIG